MRASADDKARRREPTSNSRSRRRPLLGRNSLLFVPFFTGQRSRHPPQPLDLLTRHLNVHARPPRCHLSHPPPPRLHVVRFGRTVLRRHSPQSPHCRRVSTHHRFETGHHIFFDRYRETCRISYEVGEGRVESVVWDRALSAESKNDYRVRWGWDLVLVGHEGFGGWGS